MKWWLLSSDCRSSQWWTSMPGVSRRKNPTAYGCISTTLKTVQKVTRRLPFTLYLLSNITHGSQKLLKTPLSWQHYLYVTAVHSRFCAPRCSSPSTRKGLGVSKLGTDLWTNTSDVSMFKSFKFCQLISSYISENPNQSHNIAKLF